MGDGLDAFAISPGGTLPDPWRDLLHDPLTSRLPEPRAEVALDGAPRQVDPHEFAALYMRHRWSFVRLAGRYLKDPRDADEVVQEAFLRLFLALPELDNEIVVLSYCRRTITNLCIDRLRSDQRRPRLVNLSAEVVEELSADEDPDPVEAAEDAAVVREALSLLSPLHRSALIKREIEEKPLPQIAAELDIPVDSVKHVLHRARRALRRLLVGTTVEPGVDLSVGVVLAANRQRAAAAGGQALTLIIVALLALAGLVGLRTGSDDGAPQIAVDLPAGPRVDSLGERPGLPGSPLVPANPVVPGVPVVPDAQELGPGAGTSVPPSPSSPDVPQRPVPSVPDAAAPPVAPQPVTPPAGGGGSTPPEPAPTEPTAPAEPAFEVQGLDSASGTAYLRSQTRTPRAQGVVESSSDVTVPTSDGDYSLSQTYAFQADGALSGVRLTEDVPTEDGFVATRVARTSALSERREDGTWSIRVTGVRVPVGQDFRQAMSRISVEVVLDSERVQVLRQRIVLNGKPDRVGPPPAGIADPALPVTPVEPAPVGAEPVPADPFDPTVVPPAGLTPGTGAPVVPSGDVELWDQSALTPRSGGSSSDEVPAAPENQGSAPTEGP